MQFEIRLPAVAELTAGPPEEVVLENAYRKAAAVAADADPDAPAVLGVDTIVALGATIYGQPRDQAEAEQMLAALSGQIHRVLSGVCLIEGDRSVTAVAVTTVELRSLSDGLLSWYLATGEWRGRAGSYAIQGHGAVLVRRIEGDYLNVVGLPVSTLFELAPDLIAPDPAVGD
ncbi:MAG: Maf family protein [Solirubrobacteraceae bacterium]